MNNEVKVSVTITLQGGVMLTHEEAKAREKQGLVSYDNFSMEVSDAKKLAKDVQASLLVNILVLWAMLPWPVNGLREI